MNLLAHAYLSFHEPEILVGNMISDFVKGRKQFDFPAGIQKGIVLHRNIDEFTDTNAATKRAKEVFRPDYRLYSGALTDVVFDHYLANDPALFPGQTLAGFADGIYTVLDQYSAWLPPAFARMFPYMKSHNWLLNYSTREGIEKSLQGVVRRSVYLTESETAYRLFGAHFEELRTCYQQLISQLIPYSRQRMDELLAS